MLASELIGARVSDRHGRDLGFVIDMVASVAADGTIAVTSVVTGRRPGLRLLGYQRPEIRGPWVIATLARQLQGPEQTPITNLSTD